ncbi:hypothetical protein Tco_1441184, partial [Tanacetum coccineum]
MYVDHMHQPWRTLAAIINKYLSEKAASNDRLRKSKTNILWGMFYMENVDYPELIWEDFAFQIDYRQLKKTIDTSEVDVDVSEESDYEPARKQRVATVSDLDPVRRRPSGITFRDTSSVLKNLSTDLSQKLKASGGSSEGTSVSPRVLDESIVVPATSSEGTGAKAGVPDEEKVTSKAN